MKTLTSGSSRSPFFEKYKNKLRNETLEKCKIYSHFYFKNSNGFLSKEQIKQLKHTMKKKAEKIVKLEDDNKDSLAQFLEDLILCRDNYEFLVIYHILKNNHIENEGILNYYKLGRNLGVLGNIYEIIEEYNNYEE